MGEAPDDRPGGLIVQQEPSPTVHRCRRGRRCARRDAEHQAAIVDLPGLCERDQQLLVAALRDLPTLHHDLDDPELLEPGRPGVGSRRSRGPASALPLQLTPLTVAHQIHDELTRWEDIVRDRVGLDPIDDRPRSRLLPNRRVSPDHLAVSRAAALLRRCVPDLLAMVPVDMQRWDPAGERLLFVREDGYDGAGRLIDLCGAARRAVGETELVEHLKGQDCPGCGAQTLRLISADGRVRCTSCRDVWDELEYDQLARILCGEERAPLQHSRRVWSSDMPQTPALV